jgi:hypothetical protein
MSFNSRWFAKLALVAAIAAPATGCVVRAHGRVRVPIVVVEAPPPPPPRHTIVVRPGHIWIDGHHRWDGHRYVWVEGRYERERPGYYWAPGRWERRGHGHVWIEGEWRRGQARGHDRVKVRDHRDGH